MKQCEERGNKPKRIMYQINMNNKSNNCMTSENTFTNYCNHQNIYVSKGLTVVDSSKQLINYDQKQVDNEDLDNRLVFVKYMKLSNFRESIKGSYFYFASPLQWEDPFEHKLPTEFHSEGINWNVRCCCFAITDFGNEEGFWKLFSMGIDEPIVAITFDVLNLYKQLAEHQDMKFYVNGVTYSDRDSILTAFDNISFNSYEDVINTMSMKRFAFGHEQEIRLFALSQENIDIDDGLRLKIDYSKSVIKAIVMPPLKPSKELKNYAEAQEESNRSTKQELLRLIKDYELKCKLQQSALYMCERNIDTDYYYIGK